MNLQSKENRRKFPRIMFPCLVVIRQTQDNQDVILTHTENIGVGGVCVSFKKSLKMFTPIDLEIDLLDASDPIKCNGKVVWSIHRTSDEVHRPVYYDVGIEFVGIDSRDLARIQGAVNKMEKKAAPSEH